MVGITGETQYTDVAPPSEKDYWYFVTSATRNSIESKPSNVVQAGAVVSNEIIESIAGSFELKPNYPNPFNPTTVIPFTLSNNGHVRLRVFDLLGREVASLLNEELQRGQHSVSFDATSLSSGVYVYRLEQNGKVQTRSMTLLK